jgi:hypothetical protein
MRDIDLMELSLCIGLFIVSFGVSILLCNNSKISEEKNCVIFYKENHYILESCENYRDKLLKLEFIQDNEEKNEKN